MQLLEGPEQAVLRLYVKILDDRRHGNSQVICISLMKDRLFGQWPTNAIKRNPLEFQHVTELRAHRKESVPPQTFTDAMRVFVHRLNSQSPDDPAIK